MVSAPRRRVKRRPRFPVYKGSGTNEALARTGVLQPAFCLLFAAGIDPRKRGIGGSGNEAPADPAPADPAPADPGPDDLGRGDRQMTLEVERWTLRLARPGGALASSHGAVHEREVSTVTVTDADGVCGYGQAAPLERPPVRRKPRSL